MDSVSFDYIINALIRHGHLAVTIAALSFGLAPLQLAVQSGSNDNARSIGLALVATNFFIRGYTLSLHLSSARESVSASLQEGAAAALAADNRGPPGFELGDEEREEDDDHDHENGKNSVQGLEPHGPVDLIVDEQDGLSGEEQEARAKLSSLSPPSSIIDHDTVHSQHLSSAATRLVFVPPYTHPVTGIVVPGGWLDEQQLRRALAQHTTTSERGYTSLLLTTCLERWSCACCCNDSSIGLTVTPAFSNVLVAQISNLIDYARKVVQTSPLLAFSSIMALSLSLCLPALVGSVLSSYFLHHQSSASPSQIPQQAAISIGLISLASAAIVHASEQDLRYLRLHWRRRLFDMPRVWRRSVVKLDDIRYGRGNDGPQITTTHNVDKNRRLERLVQKKQSSSSPQSPILPNNNEVIAIQNQVLRQLLFCLLAPALIVSGLKAAVATTNSSSVLIQSTPTSSIFSSMSESLNIGITTAVLLTTLFVPMIIPLIITLCYQSVGLVAMPYLCSQKWMLWLLEFLQATLQAGALVLLLAPSVLVEGGGLVGAVAGSVCSAIVFLFASSFLILVASIGFNTFCCRVRDQKIKTSTSAPTITKASIKKNKSNKVDAENTAARSSDGTPLLSRSDVIYSIFSLSGRSLSSGLALAYALSPVSQTPPFSLSQPFRTSLLLDGLLSFRAGVALSFTFYIIAQFTIFYIMDEFLRAAAFINRLKKSHEHAERDALDAISAINDASSSSSLYVSSSSDKNDTTSSSSSSPFQYSSSSSSSFPLTNQPGSSRLPFTPTPITPTFSSSSSSSSISSRMRNESISPEQRVQILADLVRQMQSPDHHHHHHHLRHQHQHRQQHQQQQKQQLPMPSFVSTHDSVSSSMSQQFVRHHAFPLSPYSLQQSHHRSSHRKQKQNVNAAPAPLRNRLSTASSTTRTPLLSTSLLVQSPRVPPKSSSSPSVKNSDSVIPEFIEHYSPAQHNSLNKAAESDHAVKSTSSPLFTTTQSPRDRFFMEAVAGAAGAAVRAALLYRSSQVGGGEEEISEADIAQATAAAAAAAAAATMSTMMNRNSNSPLKSSSVET